MTRTCGAAGARLRRCAQLHITSGHALRTWLMTSMHSGNIVLLHQACRHAGVPVMGGLRMTDCLLVA